MLGVVWKGLPERFGNHVGRHARVGLWFSSLFVPSRVGLRAGNTVGATVGFFASLRPKQNAYTKMALSKTAEFRLHVKRVEYRLVRGYLYPQPLLHNDLNTSTCPEYSTNIPGRRSFYRLECTSCLLYPIRARDAIPKVP